MKTLSLILSCIFGTLGTQAAGTLEVYWVDVEGGAATLVVTPAGESVLVDTGNPGTRDAERIHHVASEVASVKKIDHLVTTHFHGDHFGGAAMLANLMPIGTVHDNGIPAKNPDRNRKNPIFPRMVAPYRNMKVEARHIVKPGYVYPLKQAEGAAKLTVTCLAANQKFIEPPKGAKKNPLTGTVAPKPEDLSDNANSVATLFQLGEFRFFDGGDISWNVEARLVTPYNRVGVVDVFQINHHGLDVSNNPVLVNSLSPTVTVFNNGHKKGCGAGSFGTVKACKSNVAIWQAHKNLRTDSENNTDDKFIANFEPTPACKGHYLKLSVSPDGKTYAISNSRNGHKVTYETKKK